MRITFILPPPGPSGGIRVIGIYAEGLARRGHDVLLISAPKRQPSFRDKVRSLLKGKGWPKAVLADIRQVARLKVEHRTLDRWRSVTDADVPDGDVVIATWWETADGVARLSPSKGRKIYFVQDFGANVAQPIEQLARTWALPMHQIAISKYIMNLVRQHAPHASISYVPNSVDTSQFHAPQRGKQPRPTVGFVYSRTPFKGADICLKAIALASKRLPDLRVAAFGPHEPSADLPLPPGTDYTRMAPEDKLKDIYGRCDAWLFGPRMEGFGLPILEAMACRTPVIATPAGAAPELVAEGGGVLVNADDPDDMARAIVRVCSQSDADWRKMSDAALATATRYTWEDAIDLFEAALSNANETKELRIA